MTTMQIDRAAVQQALALIASARLCEVNSMSSRTEMLRLLIEATDILRAALALPCRYAELCNQEGWCANGCENPEQDHLPAVGKMVAAPVYKLQVSGRLHAWEPTPEAFSLPDGHYRLFIEPPATAAQRDALLAIVRKTADRGCVSDDGCGFCTPCAAEAAIAEVEGGPCRR